MPRSRRPLVAVIAAAALSVGGLAGQTPASIAADAAWRASAVDGPRERVIVQLDGRAALRQLGPSVATQALDATRQAIRADQRDLLTTARAAGVEARELHAYTDLIDAMALSVPAGDVDDLRRLPGVRAVYPDTPMRASTETSVPLIGAPEVWERTDAEGRQVRGEGVTVAILDTGIDYNLDDLGGGFGPDYKVVGGYDFANDDADPMDDDGHGTHVAGIIAGNGDVTGVAPEATLTAYKVLGDDGGYESDIIAGIEAAAAPDNPNRADVINMSLGGVGDGTEPIGQAATAATQEGVVVVASAGNSGPAAETVGTPAAADGVISVGASISGYRTPTMYVESPVRELLQAYRAPYSANPPGETVTTELVDLGEGTEADWERVGDVTGKIVAIETFIPGGLEQTSPRNIEEARIAEEHGAVGLIGYQRISSGPMATDRIPKAAAETTGLADVPLLTEASGDSFRMDTIVVMGVDALQWRDIAGHLAEGPVEVSISGEDLTDRVASFSSQGPTTRHTLEPDIVAPGVEIRSTWPSAQWAPGEFRLSGTSMASPHVAGAAALLRQLRPDDAVIDTAGALVGSAKALDGLGPTAQGAGRLDIAAAADATVTARPTSMSMGLADLSRDTVDGTDTVRLHNHSDQPVSVALSARRAPGSPGTVAVSPKSLTIPAGGSAEVSVRVSAPRPGVNTEVAGWLTAAVDGAPDVRVPYLLSARPLIVQASPDPSAGTSGVFVYSPAPLAGSPVLTVRSPRGATTEVPTTLDHGTWYRAQVTGRQPGVYRISARAWTAAGNDRLIGSGTLEVLAKDSRPGGDRWQPVGPNGEAGDLSTTSADSGALVATQYTKAAPWVTGDGGRTWRQAGRLPVAAGDGTVIVDDGDPDRMWYAITGVAGSYFKVLLDPTYQGKVLRTDDAGKTWTTTDFPDTQVYAFVSDPARRVLVAVTADAVVLSRDGGRTWSAHSSPISGEELVDASMGDGDLYLAGFTGVWSVRGILDGVPDGTEQVYDGAEVGVRGMIADDELVGVLDQDNQLVGSRDGGQTWETVRQFERFGPWWIGMRGGTIMVGTYNATNYLSHDHGATWVEVPRPLRGPVEMDFTPWQGDSMLYASENAGLFRTGADGSNPTRLGVPGVIAYDVAVSQGSDGRMRLLTGTDADVYRTVLPTAPKVKPSVSEWGLSGYEGYTGTVVPLVVSSPTEPSVVWKTRLDATGGIWVYRSEDGGATWEVRGRDAGATYDLAVSPHDPDRVAILFGNRGGRGVFLTRDGGETWRKYFHNDKGFSTIAMDPHDPDRLWLGGADGLYRSDDLGESVAKVASGPVTSVVVTPHRIVIGGDRIQYSVDDGQTFKTANTGDLAMRVSDIVVAPSSPGTWYAGTTSYDANGLVKGGRGVLRSTDGGRTWVNVSGGLQNLAVESLVASPGGRWLFAGTYQGGVHRLRID